jgi:predicted secreted protein
MSIAPVSKTDWNVSTFVHPDSEYLGIRTEKMTQRKNDTKKVESSFSLKRIYVFLGTTRKRERSTSNVWLFLAGGLSDRN